MHVVDFTDPAAPKALASFIPTGADTWSAKPHRVGTKSYVFTGDIDRGMDVLEFTGEGWPATAGPQEVQRAQIQGVEALDARRADEDRRQPAKTKQAKGFLFGTKVQRPALEGQAAHADDHLHHERQGSSPSCASRRAPAATTTLRTADRGPRGHVPLHRAARRPRQGPQARHRPHHGLQGDRCARSRGPHPRLPSRLSAPTNPTQDTRGRRSGSPLGPRSRRGPRG